MSTPSRVFVYCHDTFGMGNARRMMAVSTGLADAFPHANLLLASGSPVIHGFHLPKRLDYIKLPAVSRTARERYSARYLTTDIGDTIRLRSSLLKAAVADFSPDLVLIDKKPRGVMGELGAAQAFLRQESPGTKSVLVLRDILDAPAVTIPDLAESGFEDDVRDFCDRVAVLGSTDVFDFTREYRLRAETAARVSYCGYLRSPEPRRAVHDVRNECGADTPTDRLVLVTPGGGDDGDTLLEAAVEAIASLVARPPRGGPRVRALVVTGPQGRPDRLTRLQARAAQVDGLLIREFTDDMASYEQAADLVVSMGGYNAVCEALSLASRAIVVPRCRPVQEQRIRAARLSALGLLRVMYPEGLTASSLAAVMDEELCKRPARRPNAVVDMNGLPAFVRLVEEVMRESPRRASRRLRSADTGWDAARVGLLPIVAPGRA